MRQKIEYGYLVEAALRNVVRDVMGRLERGEVPDPHHFYVTFRTGHADVRIPPFLFARYPREMTIVLQHQYWDLETAEDGFSVTLSFNDKPECLYVPYEAIKVFADPGVEFGLQFTLSGDDMPDEVDGSVTESDSSVDINETPAGETVKLPARPRAVRDVTEEVDGDGKPKEGAEIVTLDRFRKK